MEVPILQIPDTPESGQRGGGRLVTGILFCAGAFALNHVPGNLFLIVWVSLVGLVGFMTLLEWRTNVYQTSRRIVKVCGLLGLVPLWRTELRTDECAHVVRRVSRAVGRGAGDRGFGDYQIDIFIRKSQQQSSRADQSGHTNDILLQGFRRTTDIDYPLSKEWAARIGLATGLPVIDEVDKWVGDSIFTGSWIPR
jgi:hypothetical protein